MTDRTILFEGEGLSCVLCGKPLAEGAIECDSCSMEAADSVPASDEIGSLVRRSRGWVLIGSFCLPLISSIVAWSYSSRALELYRACGVVDPALEGSIRRVRLAAAILTGAFAVVTLAVAFSP